MSTESEEYPKVRIRYNGPAGAHSVRGYATGQKYGYRQNGDIFYVHKDDVDAEPTKYIVVGGAPGATSVARMLPKRPGEIRPAPVQTQTASPEPAAVALQQRDDDETDGDDEILSPSITELNLDPRIAAALTKAGVETLADLRVQLAMNSYDLTKIKGIGEQSNQAIMEAVRKYGQ